MNCYSDCPFSVERSSLRNILVHDYFGIDLSLAWQVVCERLPALKASLERILTSP